MVNKNKRKTKKPAKGTNKNILLQCGDIIYKLPIRSTPETKLYEQLMVELKEELEEIYFIYLEELIKRLKTPSNLLSTYEPKEFPYRIETNKINDLRNKVKKLIKGYSIKMIYNIFYITIHKFLTDIRQSLSAYENRSKDLLILSLAEALNALECSAKELGKITENMPEHAEIEAECEKITKSAFFEKILQHYEDILLQYLSCKSLIIQNMINLLKELKNPQISSEKHRNSFDSNSSSETSSNISCKSIEEIMSYIDGDGKTTQQKKTKKKSQKMQGLDKEIEKFQMLLETFKGEAVKLKPNLSNDWICSLKLRLKNNRN
ncbi:hypothetical protein SteCoe_24819 [Stentor coeruleus]|uniref:Uncharacterized protein n=1 Tax=Stentor coeruleus TaxID=5963 RepID=A0A1R2BGS2_9CILI|nr:hypothetical protein SteCoe_24819 [Stentor coeruleus]